MNSPVPMMPMVFDWPGWREREPAQHQQVPVRIQVALTVLSQLTQKSAKIPLPEKTMSDSEISFQAIDGQKLTPTEVGVQNAALELLTGYFNGTLQPGTWDRKKARRKKALGPLDTYNVRVNCPNCDGTGRIQVRKNHVDPCPMCNGTGGMCLVREPPEQPPSSDRPRRRRRPENGSNGEQ